MHDGRRVRSSAWLDLIRVILLPMFLHFRLRLLKNIAAEATLDLGLRDFVVSFGVTDDFVIGHASSDSLNLNMVSLVKEPRIIIVRRRRQSESLDHQPILAHVFP